MGGGVWLKWRWGSRIFGRIYILKLLYKIRILLEAIRNVSQDLKRDGSDTESYTDKPVL